MTEENYFENGCTDEAIDLAMNRIKQKLNRRIETQCYIYLFARGYIEVDYRIPFEDFKERHPYSDFEIAFSYALIYAKRIADE